MAHATSDARRPAAPARAARAERGGRQPVRALRPLPGLLPDVLRAGHGDGFAARPHLPDQVARRGPHRHSATRRCEHLSLCLGLPRVRDRVPGRRAVRAADRGREGGDRAPAAGRARSAALFRWLNFGAPARPSARAGGSPRRALRLYQASGLQALVRRVGPRAPAARHAAGVGGAAAARAAARPSARRCRRSRPPRARAAARVALLTGCVQSVVFGAHNRATARVLARNGCEVVAPAGAGLLRRAQRPRRRSRARRWRWPSDDRDLRGGARRRGGREHLGLRRAHEGLRHAAGRRSGVGRARRRASPRAVQDVAEFLAREPLRGPLAPVPLTRDVSRSLPRRARPEDPPAAARSSWPRCPGCASCDLPESDWCCGSAGIYNLTQPEMADRLLRRKVEQRRSHAGRRRW